MDQWTLWFAVFLPLPLSLDTEETTVRATGKDKDVPPLCSNATLDKITSIVCKIKTKGSRGCHLQYQHGRDFEHECDSRFTLIKENQRVFLQLINLTAEDSGKYTCECWRGSRTDILHLFISEEEAPTPPVRALMSIALISICTGFIIVAVLGLVLRKNLCRCPTSTGPSGSIDKANQDATYTSLHQPPNELYQTMTSASCQPGADNSSVVTNAAIAMVTAQLKQEINRRKRDQSFDVYQNL